jgi:DNA repair protein RecN (Recombination protein N)
VTAATLRTLRIENFGLIRDAHVTFSSGLCVFSGETGSGKTMLLGALAFVLGARASADVVRGGAAKALVTLELDLDEQSRALLAEAGYPLDDDEPAIVMREMSAQGKSAGRINGRPAAAAVLRELAERVADFVGQHEAQRLLLPGRHLDVLDRFAGDRALALRAQVAAAFARSEKLAAELAVFEAGERALLAELAEAQEAVAAIDAVAPEPGEDEQLRTRRTFLSEAERIAQALAAARARLSESDEGALDRIGGAVAELARVARFSPALEALHDQLAGIESQLNEAITALAREIDATEFDPGELEAIAERLDDIERLKRRSDGSIAGVLAWRERAAETIESFEGRDERLAHLRAGLSAARNELRALAGELSAQRKAAAGELESRVADELRALAMPAARFAVAFERFEQPGARGAESAEFLLAPNAGEPPRALGRAASGGELSRVLLALVVVSADPAEASTLIFDEIDAGVGGATALAVGERLAALARTHQVICVTHLAQIASFADAHFSLRKLEGPPTIIEVVPLGAAREVEGEIARMLSGSGSKAALDHAGTLLRDARQRKERRVRV